MRMSNSEPKKLPYKTPQLEVYGTIAQLTLGFAGAVLDNKGKDKSMSVNPIT
jgi:hypothetical protein